MSNKGNKGISIIICSINQEKCEQAIKSIKNTIGTEFEVIVFDNREKNWGICKVYNYCAEKAEYRYLCFIHEDIVMASPNWGENIIYFYDKILNCGVIGFAGSKKIGKNFIGWTDYQSARRCNIYDPNYDTDKILKNNLYLTRFNPENVDFAKVVTLDGVFLFTSFEIWQETKFDEKNFQGFHFYDADFSFSIAQQRQNYVCMIADIFHFSGGNYSNKSYFENARMFQKKWKKKLPFAIANETVDTISDLNNAARFYLTSKKIGFKTSDCIRHLIAINGFISILVFFILGYLYMKRK